MLDLDMKLSYSALKEHKVICFPTETVFGLGVLYNDFEAYTLLNKVKLRREDKPYTMMLGDTKLIKEYAYIDNRINALTEKFMPGEVTFLLKAKDNVPGYVTHDSGVIGIRVPSHEVTLKLLNYIKIPLLVPSANKSGFPPAKSKDEAIAIFKDEVSYYIDGNTKSNLPSTIVDLSSDSIRLIREGSVKYDDILSLWKKLS